jgi:NAD(P)-dependent dehydrogenase (short-subunit alcohol dehydrogenase family)
VIDMCKGGARELGRYGISVNVLAPGPVDTEIMGGNPADLVVPAVIPPAAYYAFQ